MAPGFGEVSERLRRSTVQVGGRGSGSGVIWGPDGLIVTNAHVASGPGTMVRLWDGRSCAARVVARDARRDLAALKIDAGPLAAAESRDSNGVRVGELVISVGNPLGFIGAVSTGIVHALGPVRGLGPHHWVQADVRLAPGNSGGPLADASGRVIGINTMIAAGRALAVPSNAVARFLQGGAGSAWLGVEVRPVWLSQGALGLQVLEVVPGSPAAVASIRPGDVVVGASGRPFRSVDEFRDALEAARDLIHLQFAREDATRVRDAAVRLRAPAWEAA